MTLIEINPDDAEAVFYECFQRYDAEVMAALWADDEVICTHPGSDLILVMMQWFVAGLPCSITPELEFKLVKKTTSGDLSVHNDC